MNKDYYKILGINKSATEEDVKKAYRKLAHQYHPDKPSGDEKKFKEINEAYQILSSKEKRGQYDHFGRIFDQSTGGWQQSGGSPFGNGGFEFGFGFDPNNINFEDLGSMGDIFDMFFEGAGLKKKKRAYQRGTDLEVHLEITLEEAFRGVEKIINFKTFDICLECNGLGHFPKSGFTTCSACSGRGEVKENRNSFFGNFSQVKTCVKCFGMGQIPNQNCKKCSNTGRLQAERKINLNVMAGLADGQIIKITKEGEAGERGAEKGDLYVKVIVLPHADFIREEDNLLTKKELNLVDILLGAKVTVKTISGEFLNIEIPENYNLSERFRIKGEGMSKLGGRNRGDLFIQFEVKTPKKINVKAKNILEDFKREL